MVQTKFWVETIGREFQARLQVEFSDGDVKRKQGPRRKTEAEAEIDLVNMRDDFDRMVQQFGGTKVSEVAL